MKKYDYTGKTAFVGIDVHKKTYSVAVVVDGDLAKRDTMSACPSKLVDYLLKYFSGAKIKSAYEAGFSGFVLHRHLLENGIENIVVHAASIEINSRDRVKTDKRDATKIATQLSAGRLSCVYIPSPEQEDKRELTRWRDQMVRQRTSAACRIKAKAHYYGLIPADVTARVSAKWLQQLAFDKRLRPTAKLVLNDLIEEWERLSKRIKEIEKLLADQAIEDEKIDEVYRSSPGIGSIASRVLANELSDMSHFSSGRKLSSYTGLTPCEFSSGEHRRQGHISRQGKPLLRKILIQAAWIAIRHDKSLEDLFHKIQHRRGAKRAIVAVARKLLTKIYSCFKRGELYKRTQEKRELVTA